MNAYRAKPLTYPWPPALYVLAIVVSVELGRITPISVLGSHHWIQWVAGYALIAAAVALDLWAVKTLIDRHTTVLPHRGSAYLVTCGPFRFTRNPIYLGYTLIMAGLGLATQNPWFFVMASLSVAITTAFAVSREELHLLSRFGCEYERYCRATSRWI